MGRVLLAMWGGGKDMYVFTGSHDNLVVGSAAIVYLNGNEHQPLT